MAEIGTRDLWREARLRSRDKTIGDKLQEVWISLPGRPAKPKTLQFMEALARNNSIVMVDISKYEKGIRIADLWNSGMTHLCLRMGGPTVYMVDRWALEEDECYRGWFEEARDIPGLITMGYYVYCSRIDQDSKFQTTYQCDQVDRICGSYWKPQYIWLDDEVNSWTENGKTTYATAVNQVDGIKALTGQVRKRLSVGVGHYSARWFMNQVVSGSSYLSAYANWLDTNNKPENLKIDPATYIPSWYAWYVKPVGTPAALRDYPNALPIPTSTQEGAYLACGNYGQWEAWQALGDYSTAVGKIDLSISRLPREQFDAALFLEPNPGEEEGGDEEGDPEVPADLLATVAQHTADIAWLKANALTADSAVKLTKV